MSDEPHVVVHPQYVRLGAVLIALETSKSLAEAKRAVYDLKAEHFSGAPDRDEVQFDCDFGPRLPVNGWEIGRIGQNLGRDFREKRQPGWRVKRGRLRLSLWMEKEPVSNEPAGSKLSGPLAGEKRVPK